MDIIGLISFTVFLVVLVAVSYTAIVFAVKSRKQAAEIVQISIDKIALLRQLEKVINENDNRSLEQTDGFVKFLSESRDWAFDYIEKVQQSIQSLKIAVQNGSEIEEELAQLFSHLPEQQGETKNG